MPQLFVLLIHGSYPADINDRTERISWRSWIPHIHLVYVCVWDDNMQLYNRSVCGVRLHNMNVCIGVLHGLMYTTHLCNSSGFSSASSFLNTLSSPGAPSSRTPSCCTPTSTSATCTSLLVTHTNIVHIINAWVCEGFVGCDQT